MALFISLLIMLFAFCIICASRHCEIGEMPKSAQKIGEIGKPSRTFLRRFGFNVSLEVPEFDSLKTIPLPYLYSVAGFGAPFIVVFVIMVLIFLIHQLFCWCCCCVPKRSKKPTCLQVVFHLIAIAACAASACMFFFAASSFTYAINDVKHLPSSTKTEFTGVFDTVDNVLDNTFLLVHNVMDNTASNLTAFVNWIITENDKCQAYCGQIDEDMKAYKAVFDDNKGQFKPNWEKVTVAIQAKCDDNEQRKQKLGAWAVMYQSIDKGVQAVGEVTKQLTKATESIKKNAQNIKDTIDGSLKDVNAKISEYENGGLRDTIKGFRAQIDSLIAVTEPAEDGIEKYGKYINTSVYVGTAFLVLMTVIFGLFFFCNNCCSRCLACSFPLFGLLLTILIILPGVVFAASFYLFYDICPVMESKAGGLLKDYIAPKAVEEVLLCPVAKPLLDSINLGFNYREVIDDLSKQASSALKSFDIPPEMKENLKDFAKDFTVKDKMNSNVLVYENQATIPGTREYLKSSSCQKVPQPGVEDEVFDKMRQTIDSEDGKLNSARQKMENIIQFGGSIVGESEKRRDKVVGLVDSFIADATAVVEGGVNSITCETSRCVYAPVKNALCVNFLNGISFWIFSSTLMMIGVFIMECNYCCRRRNMKKVHMEDETRSTSSFSETSSSSSSSSSLDDFRRKHRKHNRHH